MSHEYVGNPPDGVTPNASYGGYSGGRLFLVLLAFVSYLFTNLFQSIKRLGRDWRVWRMTRIHELVG